MILELDIGNSRIKWRYLDSLGQPSETYYADNLDSFLQQLANAGLFYSACRVSAVQSKQDHKEKLASLLDYHVTGTILFAESTVAVAGVRNGYSRPNELGVDRWLGVVAAYNATLDACIVIDAGTAITVDLVDQDGQHLGGLIAPGGRHLQNILSSSTGLNAPGLCEVRMPQQNTSGCLSAGVKTMLAGFVLQVCYEGRQLLGQEAQVVLTGGGAGQLSGLIAGACHVVPDLVFAGLALACPLP